MSLGSGLLLTSKLGWQEACGIAWVKLPWRLGDPDQSIGSGIVVDYYNLSSQCTARVIVEDKVYIDFQEGDRTWAELALPKQLVFFLIDWAIWVLLILIAIIAIVWWIAKRRKPPNDPYNHCHAPSSPISSK
jgi:hypothetical protein